MIAHLSVLDLSPITEGSTASAALANSLELAQSAEAWGYHRFWMAEHHNMHGIASSATAVALCHVAGGTSTIRIGAGGIMLPNHPPLIIAEQFGTLATLFPGRIDLGVGRAPGAGRSTARALRLDARAGIDFPDDVRELQRYLGAADADQKVRAVPGTGTNVPVWILGSSLYGAQLAARLGLPYAFASHFAPDAMMPAIDAYRSQFEPSAQLAEPYLMLGYNICAADSDEEAQFLRTSAQESYIRMRQGKPGQLPPPSNELIGLMTSAERQILDEQMARITVGSPATVAAGMRSFVASTDANELMVTTQIYDQSARLRSYEIAAQVNASATGAGLPH